MTVLVKLFAIYRETYGIPELTFELSNPTTASEILDQIIAAHPHLEQWRLLTRFGVNLQLVGGDTILNDGDELVLIPPVSGG